MNKNLKLWHLSVMAVATCVFAVIFQILTSDMAANGGRMYDYEIFGYTLEFYRHNQFLLGEAGLEIYQYKALPLDMIYPFFYAITSLIAWEMLVKDELPKLYWIGAVMIVGVVLLDYYENLRLGLLLFGLEPASRDFVETTSLVTTTKWILLGTTVLMIMGFAGRKLFMSRQAENSVKAS